MARARIDFETVLSCWQDRYTMRLRNTRQPRKITPAVKARGAWPVDEGCGWTRWYQSCKMVASEVVEWSDRGRKDRKKTLSRQVETVSGTERCDEFEQLFPVFFFVSNDGRSWRLLTFWRKKWRYLRACEYYSHATVGGYQRIWLLIWRRMIKQVRVFLRYAAFCEKRGSRRVLNFV